MFSIKKKQDPEPEPDQTGSDIILSRKKFFAWLCAVFICCIWIFILGVLVGRGTAPVEFDINALENDLKKLAQKLHKQEEVEQANISTDFEFYEALKSKDEDIKIEVPDSINKLKQKEIKPQKADIKKIEPKEIESIPNKSISSQIIQKSDILPKKDVTVELKNDVKQKVNTEPKIDIKSKKVDFIKPQKKQSVANAQKAGNLTIQVASFKAKTDADALVADLLQKGYLAYKIRAVIADKGIWYRVRVGSFIKREDALKILNKLKKDKVNAFIVTKE